MTPDQREAWRRERQTMIGSSDAPAVVGVSPYSTRLHVYADKTEPLRPDEPKPWQRWGLFLEDAIAAAYMYAARQCVCKPDRLIVNHPKHTWMGASLDRIAADGRIVELKKVNAFHAADWGKAGTDEIPEYVIVQVHHQMIAAGIDLADVAALIGGDDLRIYSVPFNRELGEFLIGEEESFWADVQARRPPQADPLHKATLELLHRIYAPMLAAVTLDEEAIGWAASLQSARLDARDAEQRAKECQAQIIERMGRAAIGWLPNGSAIVRKNIEVAEHTVKAFTRHDLRIREPKKRSRPTPEWMTELEARR